MARGTFQRQDDGMRAEMPAGATWDWTRDESAQMTFDGDSIVSGTVNWDLELGLVMGAIVPSPTKSTVFITAPATPRDAPYRCTLTYTTVGGRTTVAAFWMYVLDPILFT